MRLRYYYHCLAYAPAKSTNRSPYLCSAMKNNTANSHVRPFKAKIKILDYITENPEEFRQTILKAARREWSILGSAGLGVEDVVGMMFIHLQKSQDRTFTTVSEVRGFIFCCTINRLRSIRRKNVTRKKVFEDAVDIQENQDWLGASYKTPASALESLDEANAIMETVNTDAVEAKVFHAAQEVLQNGLKSTTANIARQMGVPYAAVYKIRASLQLRVGKVYRDGFIPQQTIRDF